MLEETTQSGVSPVPTYGMPVNTYFRALNLVSAASAQPSFFHGLDELTGVVSLGPGVYEVSASCLNNSAGPTFTALVSVPPQAPVVGWQASIDPFQSDILLQALNPITEFATAQNVQSVLTGIITLTAPHTQVALAQAFDSPVSINQGGIPIGRPGLSEIYSRVTFIKRA
jgi:hypothetical protein